jgi:hypothetical protein
LSRYNWTHFDQSLQGISGLINVFDGPVLIAQGQEGGPFFDFNRNKSGFAPDVQLGYMASAHTDIDAGPVPNSRRRWRRSFDGHIGGKDHTLVATIKPLPQNDVCVFVVEFEPGQPIAARKRMQRRVQSGSTKPS